MTSRVKVYTPTNLKRFGKVSGDDNFLHNPNYMKKRGKHAIVHGMLLFTETAALSGAYLSKAPANTEVYFGSPASPKEELNLKTTETEGGLELSVMRGDENLLAINGHVSRIQYDAHSLETHTTRTILSQIDLKRFKRFRSLVRAAPEVAPLLYAMALGSSAIHNCIYTPQTEPEKEMAKALSSGTLPVFTALHFYTTGQVPDLNKTLEFKAGIEKEEKLHRLDVACYQGERLIYSASHHSRPTSLGVILKRMAKNLERAA